MIENYLLEHTDPEKVMFELDVYWASKGGVNPSAYIQKYAGRFPLLHIKDDNVIGASQTIDFEAIFNAAYKQGSKCLTTWRSKPTTSRRWSAPKRAPNTSAQLNSLNNRHNQPN